MQVLTVGDTTYGTIVGEIAIPGIVCDHHDCGCDRCHVGLNSHIACNTVVVSETDLDFDDLVMAATAALEDLGWGDVADIARDEIAQNIETAAQHPPGTVLRPIFDRHTDDWRYESA